MLTPDILRRIAEREMTLDGDRYVVKVSPHERDQLVAAARTGARGQNDDDAIAAYLGRPGHGRA